MIELMHKESLNAWIESKVLECLANYGRVTEPDLVKYVWKSAKDDFYLDHVPIEEVSEIVKKFHLQKIVEIDEVSGFISYIGEPIEVDIDITPTHHAKWYLRVFGNYILNSSKLLPLTEINFQFNTFDFFESSIKNDFSLECKWLKEGISSYLMLSNNGDFTIQVFFSATEHPEFMLNNILHQSAKDELMKSGLGMGLVTMHSKCKSILSKLNISNSAIITSYELLETGR